MAASPHFVLRLVGDVHVVEVQGDSDRLGHDNPWAEAICAVIDTLVKPRIVIDLKDVKWTGSKLIGSIMRVYTRTLRQGGQIRLCGVAPKFREVFKFTRVDTLIAICDTHEDAVKSFS